MIFRATDEVWAPIGTEMRSLAEQWHAPGKVDRAVRFMIASGRPEFADLLWPLISHANTQVHLPALRAAKRFRPSVLGKDRKSVVEGKSVSVSVNLGGRRIIKKKKNKKK